MSHNLTGRPLASAVASAAVAAGVLLGGCASSEPVSEPPVSTSAEQIIAGDRAVVELAQDLTDRFGPLQFSSVRAGDPLPEHARGLALDVMVPGWDTPAGQQLGDEIAGWVFERAGDYRVSYTLWRQHYQPFPAGKYQAAMMEDRGSPAANHLDHLHITVDPAGDGDV
ncbi:hypothetical protein [Rhodococcus sp. NPDC006774]|uniref:hypothetical protein n=1 Tax=Rhodococcus sp. NPDC006774 TaxID=3157186 RepID=UPI0033C23815